MNEKVRNGLSNVVMAVVVFLLAIVLSNSRMGAPLLLASVIAAIVGLVRIAIGLGSQPDSARR
jgi:hypothetical protein